MKLSELQKELPIACVTNCDLNKDINGVYIGDLLSWVMGNGEAGNLWLTVQVHINIVAIASLREFSGIVICENANVTQDIIDKANEENISIFTTSMKMYELALQLGKLNA